MHVATGIVLSLLGGYFLTVWHVFVSATLSPDGPPPVHRGMHFLLAVELGMLLGTEPRNMFLGGMAGNIYTLRILRIQYMQRYSRGSFECHSFWLEKEREREKETLAWKSVHEQYTPELLTAETYQYAIEYIGSTAYSLPLCILTFNCNKV